MRRKRNPYPRNERPTWDVQLPGLQHYDYLTQVQPPKTSRSELLSRLIWRSPAADPDLPGRDAPERRRDH